MLWRRPRLTSFGEYRRAHRAKRISNFRSNTWVSRAPLDDLDPALRVVGWPGFHGPRLVAHEGEERLPVAPGASSIASGPASGPKVFSISAAHSSPDMSLSNPERASLGGLPLPGCGLTFLAVSAPSLPGVAMGPCVAALDADDRLALASEMTFSASSSEIVLPVAGTGCAPMNPVATQFIRSPSRII